MAAAGSDDVSDRFPPDFEGIHGIGASPQCPYCTTSVCLLRSEATAVLVERLAETLAGYLSRLNRIVAMENLEQRNVHSYSIRRVSDIY